MGHRIHHRVLLGVGACLLASTLALPASAADGPGRSLRGGVVGLDQRITALEAMVASLQESLAAAQGTIGSLAGELSAAQGRIAALEAELGAARTTIQTMQDQIGALQDAAAQNAVLDHEQDGQIAGLGSQVVTLETGMAENTGIDADQSVQIVRLWSAVGTSRVQTLRAETWSYASTTKSLSLRPAPIIFFRDDTSVLAGLASMEAQIGELRCRFDLPLCDDASVSPLPSLPDEARLAAIASLIDGWQGKVEALRLQAQDPAQSVSDVELTEAVNDIEADFSAVIDLATIADLSQMTALQLQDAMNKQSQAIQTLSAILKTMHDTAKAVINNMR